MFQPIEGSLQKDFPSFPNENNFPSIQQLNESFGKGLKSEKKLNLVSQDDTLPFPDLGYEQRIYLHGLIATRKNNWHDFFNAQVWKMFPKIKSALNVIHFHEQKFQLEKNRSRRRDIMTLFDENGVFIQAKPQIQELLINHQWQDLFCEHKHDWLEGEIKITTFGHALYEKYLNPYIGMTAHAVFVDDLTSNLDEGFSRKILNNKALSSKKELNPLPLLGIPGWFLNQDESFYQNKRYFR